jgi:hypothetical protein
MLDSISPKAVMDRRRGFVRHVATLLLLPLIVSAALPALAFAGASSTTNSPSKPTWWDKYQYDAQGHAPDRARRPVSRCRCRAAPRRRYRSGAG